MPAPVLAILVGCSSGDSGGGVVTGDPVKDGDGSGSTAATDATGAQNDGSGSEPASGAAGAAAPTTTDGSASDMGVGDMTMIPKADQPISTRGQCDLPDTGFPGDDTCLLPPPEGLGMQIHVGPTDYTDQNQLNVYSFAPGNESSECISFTTPNTEEIFYQQWELSGRPGTHHIINSMYATPNSDNGTTFVLCRDPGTGSAPDLIDNLPGASKPWMELGQVAPENANLGRRIGPQTAAQADMHYFNFTDAPVLREFWLNIWFKPGDEVTEQANQIRGMGGITWTFLPIQPGTDNVYKYSCPVNAPGRIIGLLGHYHAHGVRFSAWINRGRDTERKVFEMYDYLEPVEFQYDTITENPDFSDSAAGAFTGVLEVNAGDTVDWECHIINDSATALRYTNEVETGEMCNLWGASVGPKIDCVQ
ncbi:MAG: hypothetical protein OEZ06_04890 [Myxococcales bacterium]|nr:hypothetical protein [Myxococcales bacterium]